jgi:hypothetical protein
MRINIKKILACVCCAAMMTSMFTIPAFSDDEGTGNEEDLKEEKAEFKRKGRCIKCSI